MKVFIESARKLDPGLVRYFADQAFGFMREDEARFLAKEQVRETYVEFAGKTHLSDGERKKTTRPTKTGRIRFVDFNPTWKRWRDLKFRNAPVGERKDERYWPIRNIDDRVKRVKRAAKAEMVRRGLVTKDWWFPRNCLRHSACTYGAKKFGASKAAEWAGHSEAVQKKNYRRPVSEKEADEFWNILPQKR